MAKYLWRLMKTDEHGNDDDSDDDDFLRENNNNNNWNNRKLTKSNKVITHTELIERIQKTLYFGNNKCISSSKNSSSSSSKSSSKSLKNNNNNDDDDDSLINAATTTTTTTTRNNNIKSRSKECHQIITKPFAMYAAELFSDPHKGYSLNRLNYMTVCNIEATPCSLLLAIIYLERLCDADPLFTRCLTPTELFLVSMMVSTKFYSGYDEEIYIDQWVASLGNLNLITVKQLKKLELQFLTAINWNCYVENEEFFAKLKSIEMQLAYRQAIERGSWITYTELTSNLLPTLAIAQSFLQYSTIFLISYAAGVVTIAGAFLLAVQCPGTSLYNSNNNNNNNNNNMHMKNEIGKPFDQLNTEEILLSSNETNLHLICLNEKLLEKSIENWKWKSMDENNTFINKLPKNKTSQMFNDDDDDQVDESATELKQTSIIIQLPELMNHLNVPEIGIRTGGLNLRKFLKSNRKRIRKIVNNNNNIVDVDDDENYTDDDADDDNNNFTYYNFYNEYKSLVQKLHEDNHHQINSHQNQHNQLNNFEYPHNGLIYSWLKYFY